LPSWGVASIIEPDNSPLRYSADWRRIVTPESRSVELDGVTISYFEQGDPAGVPTLLLPGFGDSRRAFEPLLAHLPESIRTLAMTPRGHGDSSHPPAGYRLNDFADDISAFMEALALGPSVLVGHSSSCFVAQRFALDHPERSLGLVFIGSPLTLKGHPGLLNLWNSAISQLTDPIDPEFVREFQRSATTAVSTTFLETTVAETMKVPARVWKATFESLLTDDLSSELGRITAPTLLVWGDQDQIATHGDQAAIMAAVPNARLAVHQGSGHSPHWENPRLVASDMVAFLEGLKGMGAPPAP
jgi:non-heme chloroperoxidase